MGFGRFLEIMNIHVVEKGPQSFQLRDRDRHFSVKAKVEEFHSAIVNVARQRAKNGGSRIHTGMEKKMSE